MAMLVKKKKTLCLTNVVSYKLDVHQEGAFDNISLVVNRMLDYINVHGTINIGPVIQYNNYVCTENGNSEMNVELLIQCKDYIHNADRPYEISSKIKVNDCYMCHYVGSESGLQYAYMKIQVEAFEDGVKLKKCNYTVFLEHNEEDETVVADVFIPVAR